MKRRESFKTQTTNDLATFSLTSNLSSSITENSTNNNNNNTNTSSSLLLSNISNNNNNSIINDNNTNTINKLKLKEICITMPVAKPTLNELKPQLSIENKQIKTAKSLIERYVVVVVVVNMN